MDDHVTIDYALPTSKTAVKPETITYLLEPTLSAPAAATNWVNKLMDRSYGESQKKKRALVLVNPHAGKGTAEKLWSKHIEPIFRAARVSIDRRTTSKGGEAVDICENMDIDAFDMVVSCSGDGLPYECFNGLGMRPDARRALGKIAVVQMPCGSGNAMAANLTGSASPSLAALGTVKGIVAPLDLMSITQGNTRTLSFLSQSVGIVAESDLATEHIRWMGQARFTYGFLIRLINKKCYPCDVAVKVAIPEKDDINTHWNAEVSGSHSSSTKLPQSSHSDLASAAASAATSSATADDGLGLPPLKYGTINDKLPSDWAVESHDEMGNFYVGNMAFMASDSNFFPAALPNDGYMDMVCIKGTIPRTAAIGLMDKVAGGKFFQDHLVSYRKVSAYRITPREQEEGWISVDGERVPFEPFQVEIHKGLGTVLAKRLHRYEAFGPQGSGTE